MSSVCTIPVVVFDGNIFARDMPARGQKINISAASDTDLLCSLDPKQPDYASIDFTDISKYDFVLGFSVSLNKGLILDLIEATDITATTFRLPIAGADTQTLYGEVYFFIRNRISNNSRLAGNGNAFFKGAPEYYPPNIPTVSVWSVSRGGTGVSSSVPYAVVCGGDPLKQVSGLGTSGQVLTSNGDALLPTWQDATGGGGGGGWVGTATSNLNMNGHTVYGATTGTFSGALSASNLSGTNTGNQTIALTGDVTGSGTGTFAATIVNNAVTLAKMAQMATASLLGRNTASTGNVEVLSASTAKSLLSLNNVENTSDANKPISTATQTALDGKLSLTGGTVVGNVDVQGAFTTTSIGPTGINETVLVTSDLDFNSNRIRNLADPASASDGVNKSYVDNLVAGIRWKQPVRVATTANGTLSTAFANGQTVDGVTLATNDRILLKDQSTGTQNGIYTVNSSGAPTRATDADSGTELVSASVYISEGTANADIAFVCTNNSITIGSTPIVFVSFSSANGVLKIANNLSDLNNAATARTNLGLGSLATQSITFGTGVATALAVNVGSAGAPVVNGGTATNLVLASPNVSNLTPSRPVVSDASKNLVSIDSPILEVSASGTVYSLTNTSAALDFGTTDPSLVLTAAGSYKIRGWVNLFFNGATFASDRTVTIKLRRSNNTAADLINGTITLHTGVRTTHTVSWQTIYWEADIYSTSNTDDAITIFADVSTVPSAGSLQVVQARVTAERVY